MALTEEQIRTLKAQLSSQIENLPPERKQQAQEQINNLSPEALETMLRQGPESEEQKSIYRMIVDKEVPSTIIEENSNILAVLEINPISEGHVLAIPKILIAENKEIPQEVIASSRKLAEKMMECLQVKTVELITENKFKEKVINLIPIYDQPLNLSSPRTKASKEDLEKTKKKLEPPIKIPKPEVLKIEPAKEKEPPLKLKRRIG